MGAAPGHTSFHMSLKDKQSGKCENRSDARAPHPNGQAAVGPEKRPVVVHALQIVRNMDATAHGGTVPLAVPMRSLTLAAVASDVGILSKVESLLAMHSSSLAIGMLFDNSSAAHLWTP